MAGAHRKGTTDADGKMGGSLPIDPRITALEAEVARLKALMRANGWSVPEEGGE